jgi:electron transfer DM13
MTTRRSILSVTVVVAVGVLWYLFRPEALIVNRRVNEPFPAVAQAMSSMQDSIQSANHAMSSMQDSIQSANHDMSSMGGSPAMAQSAAGTDHSAMEQPAMAAEDPATLSSGRFHSNAHPTSGLATIYRLPDGGRVLRLTQFATSNGPDVRVYLVAAGDVQDEAAAKQAGIVDLGALKGNIGDQNYDVPADLDLTKYRAVSIWCRRFSVNFGAAPLVGAM